MSQTGWEHLAHQWLVLGVHGHLLIKMANMLYWVRSAIVQSKTLNELAKESPFLYFACKR